MNNINPLYDIINVPNNTPIDTPPSTDIPSTDIPSTDTNSDNDILSRIYICDYLINNQNNYNILSDEINEQNEIRTNDTISDEGVQLLKKVEYNTEVCINDHCPITHESFKPDQIITILPCKHGFITSEIENWLHNKKAICPTCRYELPNKKILTDMNIFTNRNNLLSSLYRLNHPYGEVQMLRTIPHSYIPEMINRDTMPYNFFS